MQTKENDTSDESSESSYECTDEEEDSDNGYDIPN